jgi:hypothetical protein
MVELRQGGVLFNKTASAARDVFDVRVAALDRRGVAESRDQMVQGAPVSTGAEPILADASVAFATVTESSSTDFGRAAQRTQ